MELSEDVKEDDLRELFSRYGAVERIAIPKDKVTFVSRGIAFVTFYNRADAERAMEKLQGHGYDHRILKLEWARPSNRDAGKEGGLSGNAYVSGYGKGTRLMPLLKVLLVAPLSLHLSLTLCQLFPALPQGLGK